MIFSEFKIVFLKFIKIYNFLREKRKKIGSFPLFDRKDQKKIYFFFKNTCILLKFVVKYFCFDNESSV